MDEEGFRMQNQLKFNLGIPLAASNVAVRYHKPNPIIVERAAGLVNVPQASGGTTSGRPSSARSSMAGDRMALAVCLAQRDMKNQRQGRPSRSRTPSPKPLKTRFSKGGTKMVYTREANERAHRLEEKRAAQNPLRVREQGWNSGSAVPRTQTPPRDRMARLPATTNSPPTRDTDRYPRSMAADSPGQEIERMQKEMEGYLQQIQVIEQRAMREQHGEMMQPAKSRKKDGYLSDEEDPARRVLRQEEQATRAARQIYNLRQQVRALQGQVTRGESGKVKHTKKSQVMLRLAAAHRGAVRAIQGFVKQQLPQQDLRHGLPAGYKELALLIRQLALLSTQIQSEQDTANVHQDLVHMLDRVDELNKAWCAELARNKGDDLAEERRRKSPAGRQGMSPVHETKARQPSLHQRNAGKENRPKGLLKKQCYKGPKAIQKSRKPRKLTPERQGVLQAGLQALLRADLGQGAGSVGDTMVSEPANTSLILPKGLQHKREKAQRSVTLAIPESHFTDPTLASSLKSKSLTEHDSRSRDPWKPGGSVHKSPARSRSRDRSRSKSPRSSNRNFLVQDMDVELMQELFPEGVDGMGTRGRSASPRSRSHRQRSISPPRSPGSRSRFTAHKMRSRLDRLQRGTEDAGMVNYRERELSEINIRQRLADKTLGEAELNGELMTDMILSDLIYDTASELQSLEDDSDIQDEVVTMHHNPTLENMYQRLEQMELEQIDIRRRWGTLHFEGEQSSSLKKFRNIERPSAPVAMEISRRDPSQSHRVQSTRAYDRDTDAPIIFTKSAPAPKYRQRSTIVETEDDLLSEFPADLARRSSKIRLKLPESTVKEIHSNLEKYERHLRKTSYQSHSKFDPWKLVEEISDQVLSECLKEIEKEFEDVQENIVHQVCKSEFAIPEPSLEKQEVVEDYGYDLDIEPVCAGEEYLGTIQEDRVNIRTSQQESAERSIHPNNTDKSRENGTSSRKEVSFDQDISHERGINYEHEAVFDAADLDAAVDDRDTPRGPYEDDDMSYEDDDDDDDISEVSPIESEDLEYSSDET